jgi:hypothetical protein
MKDLLPNYFGNVFWWLVLGVVPIFAGNAGVPGIIERLGYLGAAFVVICYAAALAWYFRLPLLPDFNQSDPFISKVRGASDDKACNWCLAPLTEDPGRRQPFCGLRCERRWKGFVMLAVSFVTAWSVIFC